MKKKKKVNRNTYHISSIKRLTRKFLEVLRSSRAKQRQSNVQKSVLNVQSCFFANYDLKNNLREFRFQPWLNQCIKLSFSLFHSSFIFQSNVQKSVLNVQSCFFANYDLKNNLRELRFQPWLNQCIKLSFSLFYSSFIFQGIFEESFVESLLDPQFIKNITENTEENNSWETKYGKSVNESLREFLVDYLGKPIHEFFT